MPTNYVNRQVWIWKIFLDEVTGQPIADTNNNAGDEAILLFQGIITSAQYKENQNKATMSWGCKSHWGDFKRLSGRLTSPDFHQALTAKGEPNSAATIKPSYAGDYGFMWAERAVNVLLKYDDQVEKSRQIDINGWWFGGKRQEKYMEDVVREVDLRMDITAKYLPTVYGVRRVKGNPVFADIGSASTETDTVWLVDALAEGPIQSVMNLYLDDGSLVCVDAADKTARSSSGESDLVCFGRQDKGDVLTGQPNTAFEGLSDTTSAITIDTAQGQLQISSEEMDAIVDISEGGDGSTHPTQSIHSVLFPSGMPHGKQNPSIIGGTQGGAGITHERVLKLDQPVEQYLEFHNGIVNQQLLLS